MTICVIHPNACKESAKKLADAFGWKLSNPFKEERRDYREYDGVFNYGCNRRIYAKNIVNNTDAVATCINKIATFKAFKKAGIPTVAYCTHKADVPKEWETVVVRNRVDGARAEGLEYWYSWEHNKMIPDGELYTEYFKHKQELRVMVFCGHVVAAYDKEDDGNGTWNFMKVEIPKDLAEHAKRAATALGIDYVGFDVLVNEKGVYAFLEANSGPILVDEIVNDIKSYFQPK